MKGAYKCIRKETNMGRRAKVPMENLSQSKSTPALTPEDREKQIIAMAYDRAEQQILDGTVSSQVLTHFLKQGTIERELELEKLKKENALLEAKKSQIESTQRIEALYADAIEAMKKYRNNDQEQQAEQ